MKIQKKQLIQANKGQLTQHKKELKNLVGILSSKGINANAIIKTIQNYEVAIPSWALGAGGTRFGRFGFGGEPSNLHEEITRYQFFLQLKRDIIRGILPGSYETMVELGAQALQCKYLIYRPVYLVLPRFFRPRTYLHPTSIS